MAKKIVVVGKGGREHALAHGLRQGRSRPEVFVAPGNPGMERAGIPTLPLDMGRGEDLLALVHTLRADLVVFGPEEPLVAGLSDPLREAGVAVVGPGRAAALLEGSKAFAKEVMEAAGIPTARHRVVVDAQELETTVRWMEGQVALKADGLAQGKGVVVAAGVEEALAAGRRLLAAHGRLVVEERLEGEEMSLVVLTDGKTAVPFPLARDHKRRFDGDKGPNTGGMGAVAPVGTHDEALALVDQTVTPLLRELARRGISYRGVLYAGLMMTASGPRVIEYNVRMGDPETQVVLPLLTDDLAERFFQVAEGHLQGTPLAVRSQAAAGVVVVAPGYPDSPDLGASISVDLGPQEEQVLFWSGVRGTPDQLRVGGGRVAVAVGMGTGLREARHQAYQLAERIEFKGADFRRDIGLSLFGEGTLG